MSHTTLNEYFVLACLGSILAAPFLFRYWLNRYPVRSLSSVETATGRMSMLIFGALFTGGFVFGESSRSAGKVLLLAAIFSFYVLYQSRYRYINRSEIKTAPRPPKLPLRIQLGKLAFLGFFSVIALLLTRAPYLAPILFLTYPFLVPALVRLQYPSTPMVPSPLKSELEGIFRTAGVNLKEIYLLDSGGVSSDALMARNTLFLTVKLFEKLNEAEIKAVVAHEASHLQQNHLWKRMFASAGFFLLAAFWILFPASFVFLHARAWLFLTIPLMIVVQLVFTKKAIFRQELEADLGAVGLGASSDALVSALHKLSPQRVLTSSARFFSGGFHPSNAQRENAIRSGQLPKNAYFRRKSYAYAYSLLVLGYVFHAAQTAEFTSNRGPANENATSANITRLEPSASGR